MGLDMYLYREAEAIAMISQWKQKLIDHVIKSDSVFDRRSKERNEDDKAKEETQTQAQA